MSEYIEMAMTDLYTNVSFGGGGRSSSGGGGGSTMTSSPRPRSRPAHITPASGGGGSSSRPLWPSERAVIQGLGAVAGSKGGVAGAFGGAAAGSYIADTLRIPTGPGITIPDYFSP